MRSEEGGVMGIEKLKTEFEQLKYIKEKLEYLNFDEHLGCYVEKNNGMPVGLAAWVNGAFYGFEQAAKAQAVPEGFVVCKSEPVAYIVQNKFWKQKFDVKSVKDMPPQKWEDDHYDVEIPLYAVSLDGLVLKEQDEDEAND